MKFRPLSFDYHAEATDRLLEKETRKSTVWVLPPNEDGMQEPSSPLDSENEELQQIQENRSEPIPPEPHLFVNEDSSPQWWKSGNTTTTCSDNDSNVNQQELLSSTLLPLRENASSFTTENVGKEREILRNNMKTPTPNSTVAAVVTDLVKNNDRNSASPMDVDIDSDGASNECDTESFPVLLDFARHNDMAVMQADHENPLKPNTAMNSPHNEQSDGPGAGPDSSPDHAPLDMAGVAVSVDLPEAKKSDIKWEVSLPYVEGCKNLGYQDFRGTEENPKKKEQIYSTVFANDVSGLRGSASSSKTRVYTRRCKPEAQRSSLLVVDLSKCSPQVLRLLSTIRRAKNRRRLANEACVNPCVISAVPTPGIFRIVAPIPTPNMMHSLQSVQYMAEKQLAFFERIGITRKDGSTLELPTRQGHFGKLHIGSHEARMQAMGREKGALVVYTRNIKAPATIKTDNTTVAWKTAIVVALCAIQQQQQHEHQMALLPNQESRQSPRKKQKALTDITKTQKTSQSTWDDVCDRGGNIPCSYSAAHFNAVSTERNQSKNRLSPKVQRVEELQQTSAREPYCLSTTSRSQVQIHCLGENSVDRTEATGDSASIQHANSALTNPMVPCSTKSRKRDRASDDVADNGSTDGVCLMTLYGEVKNYSKATQCASDNALSRIICKERLPTLSSKRQKVDRSSSLTVAGIDYLKRISDSPNCRRIEHDWELDTQTNEPRRKKVGSVSVEHSTTMRRTPKMEDTKAHLKDNTTCAPTPPHGYFDSVKEIAVDEPIGTGVTSFQEHTEKADMDLSDAVPASKDSLQTSLTTVLPTKNWDKLPFGDDYNMANISGPHRGDLPRHRVAEKGNSSLPSYPEHNVGISQSNFGFPDTCMHESQRPHLLEADKTKKVEALDARKFEKKRKKKELKDRSKQKRERKKEKKRKRSKINGQLAAVRDDSNCCDDEVVCVGVRNSPEEPVKLVELDQRQTASILRSPTPNATVCRSYDSQELDGSAPKRSGTYATVRKDYAFNIKASNPHDISVCEEELRIQEISVVPQISRQGECQPNPRASLKSQEVKNHSKEENPLQQSKPPGQNHPKFSRCKTGVDLRATDLRHEPTETDQSIAAHRRLHRANESGSGESDLNLKTSVPLQPPRSKFAMFEPIKLLCSERFIENWGEAIAELASGRWTNSFIRDAHKSIPDPMPDSAIVGRKIQFVDTSVVDLCGVDIEVPGRNAVIVSSLSSWGANDCIMKAFLLDIIQKATTGRYKEIFLVVCVDTDITSALAQRLQKLHNGLLETPFPVYVHICSWISLSSALADYIFAKCASAEMAVINQVVSDMSNEKMLARAKFIVSLNSTISAMGSVQLLTTLARGRSPTEQFQILLASEIERKKVQGLLRQSDVFHSEVNMITLTQVSCAVNACLVGEFD